MDSMKTFFAFLSAAILISGCTAPTQNQNQTQTQPQAPAQQPEAAKLTPADVPPPTVSWDNPPDFKTLRETYGLRVDFDERCELNYPGKAIAAAYNAKNFQEGVDQGNAWLQQCPVDAEVHMLVAYGLHMLGKEDQAGVHG